jgi:hypothetical protein
MHGSISKAQRFVNENVDTEVPRHGKIILGMHGHIQGRSRRSFDARWSSDHLHLKKIEKA